MNRWLLKENPRVARSQGDEPPFLLAARGQGQAACLSSMAVQLGRQRGLVERRPPKILNVDAQAYFAHRGPPYPLSSVQIERRPAGTCGLTDHGLGIELAHSLGPPLFPTQAPT